MGAGADPNNHNKDIEFSLQVPVVGEGGGENSNFNSTSMNVPPASGSFVKRSSSRSPKPVVSPTKGISFSLDTKGVLETSVLSIPNFNETKNNGDSNSDNNNNTPVVESQWGGANYTGPASVPLQTSDVTVRQIGDTLPSSGSSPAGAAAAADDGTNNQAAAGAEFIPHDECKHLEIDFSPAEGGVGEAFAQSVVPLKGSFIERESLSRTATAAASATAASSTITTPVEREINFSTGGSNLSTAAPPNHGSFAGNAFQANAATAKRKMEEDEREKNGMGEPQLMDEPMTQAMHKDPVRVANVVEREINFSPGGSDLSTAAPPNHGSFAGNASQATASATPRKIEAEKSRVGESQLMDVPMTQAMHKDPVRAANVVEREINFSPGASNLSTAAPPTHGSFAGNTSQATAIPTPSRMEETGEPQSMDESMTQAMHKLGEAIHKQDIEFSPGGNTPPTAPVPVSKKGSYMERSPNKMEDQESRTPGSVEINFCPGGSQLTTGSIPNQGGFVEKERIPQRGSSLPVSSSPQLGGEYAQQENTSMVDTTTVTSVDSDSESDILGDDQDRWKSKKLFKSAKQQAKKNAEKKARIAWEKEKQPEAEIQVASNLSNKSDDYVPDESILKMEQELESALNQSLDSPSKSETKDEIVPSASMESGDYGLDDSTLKMEALLESALNGELVDDDPPSDDDTEPRRNEETRVPPHYKHQDSNATPIVSNLAGESDDYVPNESMSRMEAMLENALDQSLDDFLNDEPATAAEHDTVQSKTKNHEGFVPDDSISRLEEATLGRALDDELSISFDSFGKEVTDIKPHEQKVPQTKPTQKRMPAKPTIGPLPNVKPTRRRSPTRNRVGNTAHVPKPALAARTQKAAVPKLGVAKAAERKIPAQKTTGTRRSFMYGNFASRKKDAPPPQDADDERTASKKGGAKKIISRITSWAKKGSPSTNTANDYRVQAYPPFESRQKFNPKPTRLFADSSSSSKRNAPKGKPASTATSRTSNNVFERLYKPKPPPLKQPTPPERGAFMKNSSLDHQDKYLHSSSGSLDSLSSQCSVTHFESPRRTGKRGCQKKFNPYLHISRGPCELCVFFLSDQETARLDATGRHVRVMYTTGGCCMTCKLFPRSFDEQPARLCRACFCNSHREIYQRITKRRTLLRK
jgi:hypothetical protein